MQKWVEKKTVIEKYMLTNPTWSEGYRVFNNMFGKPLGWLYLIHNGKSSLVCIDKKGHCSFYKSSTRNQSGCHNFLGKYLEQLKENEEKQQSLPFFYKCTYGREGIIFPIDYLHQLKGFLILCSIGKSKRDIEQLIPLFYMFLRSQTDLAYKNFELQNFFETVHPRALALSTMHSVHRVISSSLHLSELLPRIGRLCAQVLKAQSCTIYLLDETGKYIVPKFSITGNNAKPKKSKIRVGRGMEGHVAETAEFYFSRNCISVPFIEEDVIGVVSLRNKVDREAFNRTDLEILKTLSEQAVVAIKNAKLFEQTEQLTLGSIQAINELLELNYSGDHSSLPLFGELVFEIGKELRLSGMDLTNLHHATFLIDTGHLGIPERILSKKAGLTKKEFEEIKKHPNVGASVLNKVGSLKDVIPMILYHHERYDGTGYPHKLKGDAIPMGARIVSVVDSFIAMLSKRPYRSPKGLHDAIEEIKKNSGTQFDPVVVERFIKVIQRPEIYKKVQRYENQEPGRKLAASSEPA